MKKWHIVAIVTGVMVVAITVCSVLVMSFVMKPKMAEPIIETACGIVDDDLIEQFEKEAKNLHNDGALDDSTYVTFRRAYSRYTRDDEAYINEILSAIENDDGKIINEDDNSVKTKYASYKVGVEVVKVNNTGENGKAAMKYSTARTSDRISTEDYIEAETLTNSEKDDSENDSSSFEKLQAAMTGADYSKLVKLVAKIGSADAEAIVNSSDNPNEKLKSELGEEDYRELVNLAYKYITVFMKK